MEIPQPLRAPSQCPTTLKVKASFLMFNQCPGLRLVSLDSCPSPVLAEKSLALSSLPSHGAAANPSKISPHHFFLRLTKPSPLHLSSYAH